MCLVMVMVNLALSTVLEKCKSVSIPRPCAQELIKTSSPVFMAFYLSGSFISVDFPGTWKD